MTQLRSAMTDDTADTARLVNVIEAIADELERQGLVDILTDDGFDVTALAEAVLRAADGIVIPFPGKRP
jgi:hypothetical protein